MWLARLYSKWRSGMTPREKLTKTICLSADVTIVSAHSILDAILATLPALGLKIVPVEATHEMRKAGRQAIRAWNRRNRQEDGEISVANPDQIPTIHFNAMLAAAPDVLGEGK